MTILKAMYLTNPNNKIYKKALNRESACWSKITIEQKQKSNRERPLIKNYINLKITGNSKIGWQDLIKQKYEKFQNVCSLGSGIGFIEENFLKANMFKRLEVIEVSDEAVENFLNRLKDRYINCQIRARNMDINFLKLEQDHYDFILCNTILHHLINLEHVLIEINKALTANGILVIFDFVGENRFQWEKNKIEFLNTINKIYLKKFNAKNLNRPNQWGLKYTSPFEAIRSQEIPTLINKIFGKSKVIEKKFYHILYHAFAMLDFTDWDATNLNKAIEFLVELEEILSKRNIFKPCWLFGIYQKSNEKSIPISEVKPLSNLGIYKHLDAGFYCIYNKIKNITKKIEKSVMGIKKFYGRLS